MILITLRREISEREGTNMKQARKFVTSLLAVLLLFSTLTVGFAAEEQAVAVDFEDIHRAIRC